MGDVADPAAVDGFEPDRRELLRRGAGLGGTALLASSIPLLWSVRSAFADAGSDVPVMQSAINLELVTVIAYDTVIAASFLSPAVRAVLQGFRAHEQAHADALTTALTDLGGAPPPAPKGVGAVDKVVEGLSDVRTQNDVLTFLISLEMAAVAAYFDAQAKLGEARLLQTTASIMANEGQHLAILRRRAGKNPLPNAFENGKT
jgi:ferritin-like protein